MSVSLAYAKKNRKDLSQPFEREKFILDSMILGSGSFNEDCARRVVAPYGLSQEDYDKLVKEIAAHYKREEFSIGHAKVNNKTVPQLSMLVVSGY